MKPYSHSHSYAAGLSALAACRIQARYFFTFQRWLARLRLGCLIALLCSLGLLASCGGGDSVAGLGSGGTGVNLGTVTGFGSVFIDGQEIDDSALVPQTLGERGEVSQSALLQLGQQVSYASDSQGAVTRIEVWPQVVGAIQSLSDKQLTVAGQTILVNPEGGPITVWGSGLSSIASLKVGDAVEVHGLRQSNGFLWATRIEGHTVDGTTRVMGPIQTLAGETAVVQIGGLKVNLSQISGLTFPLVEQTVWWASGTLNGDTLSAKFAGSLGALRAAPGGIERINQVDLIGNIAQFDGSRLLTLRGVQVDTQGLILPAGCELNRNTAVRVIGKRQASSSEVRATSLSCLHTDDQNRWKKEDGKQVPLLRQFEGTVLETQTPPNALLRLQLGNEDKNREEIFTWNAQSVVAPGVDWAQLTGKKVDIQAYQVNGVWWIKTLKID